MGNKAVEGHAELNGKYNIKLLFWSNSEKAQGLEIFLVVFTHSMQAKERSQFSLNTQQNPGGQG